MNAPAPGNSTRRGTLFGWIRVGAIAAAGLSLYLTIASVQAGPVGCGAGSGCAQVLSSRWSQLLGVPVGALAVLLYGGVLALTFTRYRTALAASAVIISGAALWFIALQALVLKAVCPWCMADHALGLVVAGLILAATRPRLAIVLAGLAPVAALALVQVWQPAADVRSTDVQLTAEQLAEPPRIGSPNAPHQLALLYDYRCPHCRLTHGFMLQALDRYPGQIALALLPTPLSNKCNPYFSPDFEEPRFVDSCELAQTALAVWHAAPEQFPALDAWMFQPENPRTADEAKAHAERLIGADALDAAVRSGYPAAQIRRNADLFHEHKFRSLPAILSPSMPGVVVRVHSASDLFKLLEKRFGIRAAESAYDGATP